MTDDLFMKSLFFILTIAAFLQTTFLPINLVLIIIICRSVAYNETSNYYYAFFAGIILGLLSAHNLGFFGLVFLIIVKLAHIIRKLPITTNIFTIIIITFALTYLTALMELFFLKISLNLQKIIIESLISLPVFVLIRIWEERFIVRSDIKLKIRE